MNEQIKELSDRIPEAEWTIDRLASIEKFAQLIVRECAHVGFNAAYPGKGINVKTSIKEHFGVEE